MRFKLVKIRNFYRLQRSLKRQFFDSRRNPSNYLIKLKLPKFIPCSKIVNCFNANTKNFVNFPDIFYIFNEVKRCIFVFREFLEDVRFLENRNDIFEENSLKASSRQSFRVSYFSNLSSDSRYFESVTLNVCYFHFISL